MKLSPLALGGGAGLLAMLVLAPATGSALGELRAARAEHARLVGEAARPQPGPLLAGGLAVIAPDAAAARGAIAARVQRLAKSGGVLVEERVAAQGPAGIAALRLRVSGAEKAVIAFADALERERPLMRLGGWRVEPVTGGGVRLSAEVLAAWRSGSAAPSGHGLAAPVPGPISAVYERSLFGAAPEAVAETLPADAPALVGIAGRLGADAVALVRTPEGTRTLRIGESVDGWRLASLAIDAAFFTRGAERVRVPMPASDAP